MDSVTGWIARLLQAARVIYVLVAAGCIAAVILGLVVALYFQSIMIKGPARVAIPAMPAIHAPAIRPDAVAARLLPPTNVRFVPGAATISVPVSATLVLGIVRADTANGLARFPEDLDIIGARDSELFDRAASPAGGQNSVLVPTSKLVERINASSNRVPAPRPEGFELLVVVRDVYGMPSGVTKIAFDLTFVPAAAGGRTVPAAAPEPASDLERLAREIALIAGQDGSPAFSRTYERAMRQPIACGATRDDAVFLLNYRRVFDQTRGILRPMSLPAFFDGICDAWRRATSERADEIVRAQAAIAAANGANLDAELRYRFEYATAWASRNLTLIVVAAAFLAFLVLSLLLAFLAIENHSNAMRHAIAAISQARREETARS